MRSFRTHAAYLRAFRQLALGTPEGSLRDALAALAAHGGEQWPVGRGGRMSRSTRSPPACAAPGPPKRPETTAELAADAEVIPLANSWGAVQAYYAMYGATLKLCWWPKARRDPKRTSRP